jgi:hypothetical protein
LTWEFTRNFVCLLSEMHAVSMKFSQKSYPILSKFLNARFGTNHSFPPDFRNTISAFSVASAGSPLSPIFRLFF